MRRQLDEPHAKEHASSLERLWDKGRPPRDLAELIRWFLAEWAAEVPDSIHAGGVWRDYGMAAVGGSLLGSPRDDDAFRKYLYEPTFLTDFDRRVDVDERGSVFLHPVHYNLALWARSSESRKRQGARLLFGIACSGGDWRNVLRAWVPFEEDIAYRLLRHFWREYEREPLARVVA